MLILPSLRPDQLAIAQHPAKIKTLAMGRRWGKTILGGVLAVNTLARHGKVGWCAPTYKNTRPLWRWVQATCGGEPAIRLSRSERTLETSRGGLLAIYSGDNADAIRGESFHLMIVDEAAMLPEEAITDVIMPTLADFDGDLIVIGTPKGKNWFYHWYQRGLSGDAPYMSWRAPTRDNPIPNIRRAAELARERRTERSYRQEWEAAFIDDGGEVFRNVRACATVEAVPFGQPGHQYIIGVDPAKQTDYFVAQVMDVGTHEHVHQDRSNHVEYTLQAARLKALSDRFNGAICIIETNGNEAFIELAIQQGIPVQRFTTTNATKYAIIEKLTVALERMEIAILNDAILIGELEAFSGEKLPSGTMRYGAPSGMHDDTVMALAFAWQGIAAGQLEWTFA